MTKQFSTSEDQKETIEHYGNYNMSDFVRDATAAQSQDAERIHVERLKRWSEMIKLGKDLRFDIDKHVEEQVFTLKVKSKDEYWNIAGQGALGVIAGQPKSRKTAVTSAIEAAALGNKDVLGFSLDIQGGRICSFDTEQREGSFAKVRKNVYSWAGIKTNIEIYESYQLRSLYPDQRLEFIQAHVFDPNKEKPKLLVIDVITDLLYDFNDHVKSQLIVEEVMKMAGKETLTLMTIHLGKAGHILGHIGSALARKVDFAFEVKLEEGGHSSEVECKLSRDAPHFPSFSIHQDRYPPRIYRPDLETGGWVNEEQEMPIIGVPSNGNFRRLTQQEIDDVPF